MRPPNQDWSIRAVTITETQHQTTDMQQDVPHGAQVLNETRDYAKRFVRFPNEAAADVFTLWVAATHARDTDGVPVWEAAPRMLFTGNEPGCGKSEALKMACRLAARGEHMSEVTHVALAAAINADQATPGMDELDLLFGPRSNGMRLTRMILNDGFNRGASMRRGDRKIKIYAFMAGAGLATSIMGNSNLDTLRDRSWIVLMRKVTEAQASRMESYRDRMHGPTTEMIRTALSKWIGHGLGQLATAWPDMPSGFYGRLADKAECLLAVADYAGGDWPERARKALTALAFGRDDDGPLDPTPGERIFADIARVRLGAEKLSTVDLLGRLQALPDAPWQSLWPNPGTAPRELSTMLRPHGVKPVKVWDDGRALQGYDFTAWPEDFQELCENVTPAPEDDDGYGFED